MSAIFPAPELKQAADVTLLLNLSEVIRPGFLQLRDGFQLNLTVDGNYKSDEVLRQAGDDFQVLLGAVRALQPTAGERQDEAFPTIGSGAIQDEKGNQVAHLACAVAYMIEPAEMDEFAQNALSSMERVQSIRDALWLNGRRDRNAADAYMILEFIRKDLGQDTQIANALGVTQADINKLTQSANNLAPKDGGRHASMDKNAPWDLKQVHRFTGTLLCRWMRHRAK